MANTLSYVPSDYVAKLANKWFNVLVSYVASGIIVTPYKSEKQFEYDKGAAWPIYLVHGLEDKNGDIYILWDNDNKKMCGKTISRKRFNRKYFIEAL